MRHGPAGLPQPVNRHGVALIQYVMSDNPRTKLEVALHEERARILEELHRSQERYRVFFDTAFAGIGITDKDENLVLLNAAFEDILGYGRDELAGVNLAALTSAEEFARYRAFTQRRRHGERDFYESVVRGKDGAPRRVLVSAAPLTDGDGTFAGTMAVLVDITEWRSAEQELEEAKKAYTKTLEDTVAERTRELERAQAHLVQTEKMAAMGKLAAGVAHEINNPAGVLLMKLKFLLSIAAEEGLSPRAESTLRIAVEQTERIESIVESLLSFSRPAPGTARRLELAGVIGDALALARGRAATITSDIADDLPEVEADPNEIVQILINLIDNAVDAIAESGHVWVRAHAESTDSGRWAVLSVEDDGCGIAADFRDLIFDPFFTTKQVGEGTGLGLAITYGIVQKQGGSIQVDSERHRGTTVTVRLPAAPAAAQEPSR